MSNEQFRYYIDHVDKRLDKIEEKVDALISFRVMLLGAAAGISGLVSVLIYVIGMMAK